MYLIFLWYVSLSPCFKLQYYKLQERVEEFIVLWNHSSCVKLTFRTTPLKGLPFHISTMQNKEGKKNIYIHMLYYKLRLETP